MLCLIQNSKHKIEMCIFNEVFRNQITACQPSNILAQLASHQTYQLSLPHTEHISLACLTPNMSAQLVSHQTCQLSLPHTVHVSLACLTSNISVQLASHRTCQLSLPHTYSPCSILTICHQTHRDNPVLGIVSYRYHYSLCIQRQESSQPCY